MYSFFRLGVGREHDGHCGGWWLLLVSAIAIGHGASAKAVVPGPGGDPIECVLKPMADLDRDEPAIPGPVRKLRYGALEPIDGLDPVGGLAFGNARGSTNHFTVDLNGDGLQDIVTHLGDLVFDPGPPTPIQILFNAGDGRLIDCTGELMDGDIPVMQVPRDIHVADFNGDGLPDIFFSNHGTEAIQPFPCEQNRLLLSNRESRLVDMTATHLPQVADFSHGSSVADVDLDGDIDIYVNNLGCEGGIGSYLMHNDGNGMFTIVAGGEPTIHAFFAHEGPTWSAFIDHDHDGDQDFFAASVNLLNGSNEISVANLILVNEGLGNFHENNAITLPPPVNHCPGSDTLSFAQDVWIDDINHDGWLDLAVYYSACDTPIIQLLMNDAEGNFADETAARIPPHETAVYGSPTFMVADVDGNRSSDIVFEQHQADDSVTPYYFFNDGSGKFVRDNPGLDQYLGSHMIPIDLNRDGVKDQVYTTCHTFAEDGCQDRRWYRRIIQAVPDHNPAFDINPGLNDAWLNAATAGQGFFIIVFPDTGIVFLAWFTYDTELPPEDVEAILGAAEHRWLTAQGPYAGDTATLDVFLTEGGVFDMTEPAPTTGEPIGTITIQWTDCENGVLTYAIDPPGVSGEIPITRIVPDNALLCEALKEQ